MKRAIMTTLVLLALASGALADGAKVYLGHEILGPGLNSGRTEFSQTWNRTLSPDTLYTLTGLYYVEDGYDLNIPAGTVCQADTAATLIISRGGQIFAEGTADEPVVFTSMKDPGEREPGDWGGLVILGRAPVNKVDPLIEGGIIAGTYGGTDPNDDSGVLSYVRLEYPGYRFQLNNEVNGLTMGAVGAGTEIHHVQVSYSFDDSYEWFGGTVNPHHLIAMGGTDDEFDCDFGFTGDVQFGFTMKDPNYSDPTGSSNGFETDNDGDGSGDTPITYPHFSNVTMVGPERVDSLVGNLPVGHSFKNTGVLRRNSRTSVYNSTILGYPSGLSIRDASIANAVADILRLRHLTHQTSGSFDTGRWPDVQTWFNTAAFNNDDLSLPSEVGLTDMSDLNDPNPIPAPGSPLIGTADFASFPELAGFTVTTYRGAFDPALPMSEQWTAGWANFDPNGTPYSTAVNGVDGTPARVAAAANYPNPFNPSTTIKFNVPHAGRVSLKVYNLRGQVVADLVDAHLDAGAFEAVFAPRDLASGTYMYRLQGEGFSLTRSMQLVK